MNKRHYPRYPSKKIGLEIDGVEMDVIDISATGFQFRGGPDWIVVGQGLSFVFSVPIRGKTAFIRAEGQVVRCQGGTVAVHYQSPHENWKALVTQFLSKG